MPRKPRVFADGAVYHVFCRFGHEARVFSDREEARRFLANLREVVHTDGLTMLAWCLMPTHYHLALRTGQLPLWRSLRLIQGRFASSHNRRHRTLGPLWQGRYKARLVEDQAALDRLIAYVHLNPVKAGLVRSPAAYVFSGHRELLGRVREPLVDVDATLRLYGAKRSSAVRAYETLVRAVGKEAWSKKEPGQLPWWHRIPQGSETLAVPVDRPALDALGASTAPGRLETGLGEVLAAVGKVTGLEPGRLASPVRDGPTVEARELLAVVAVHRCGLRVKAIAECLGKSSDTVSRWVTRGAQRGVSDLAFRRLVDRLEKKLRARWKRVADS
jgi:putative transposase